MTDQAGDSPKSTDEQMADLHTENSGLNTQMTDLRSAGASLSADISGLKQTLLVVKDLQVQQSTQAERQRATDMRLERDRIDSMARESRLRRTLSILTLVLGVTLPLVSILVYAALISHVDALLDEQKASAYTSCTVRNRSAIDNADREKRLAALEPTAQLRAVHAQSSQELRQNLNDCSKYKKAGGK